MTTTRHGRPYGETPKRVNAWRWSRREAYHKATTPAQPREREPQPYRRERRDWTQDR